MSDLSRLQKGEDFYEEFTRLDIDDTEYSFFYTVDKELEDYSLYGLDAINLEEDTNVRIRLKL